MKLRMVKSYSVFLHILNRMFVLKNKSSTKNKKAPQLPIEKRQEDYTYSKSEWVLKLKNRLKTMSDKLSTNYKEVESKKPVLSPIKRSRALKGMKAWIQDPAMRRLFARMVYGED